jgi:hypothetical protein
MALAVVQAAAAVRALATLGVAPTVNNLVIGSYYTAGVSNTSNNGWTFLQRSTNSYISLYYRYVQVGDGATYATTQPLGVGSEDIVMVWEVSGAGLTWSVSLDQSKCDDFPIGNTSNTSTALTTAARNELALVASCYCQSSVLGPPAPTFSAGWSSDAVATNGAAIVSGNIGHQTFVSSGSSVQVTATYTQVSSTQNAAIATLLLKAPTPSQAQPLIGTV